MEMVDKDSGQLEANVACVFYMKVIEELLSSAADGGRSTE